MLRRSAVAAGEDGRLTAMEVGIEERDSVVDESNKNELAALLEEMGVEDDRAKTLKKDHLVAFVVEAAAERQWAPAALSWDAAGTTAVEGDAATPDDATEEPVAPPSATGVSDPIAA